MRPCPGATIPTIAALLGGQLGGAGPLRLPILNGLWVRNSLARVLPADEAVETKRAATAIGKATPTSAGSPALANSGGLAEWPSCRHVRRGPAKVPRVSKIGATGIETFRESYMLNRRVLISLVASSRRVDVANSARS
jgi:hypothetical protein